MKNIFEDIKNTVKNAFHSKDNPSNMENMNKSSVNPGPEEKEEDVGKKVFEKSGHLHEGVGQSSTPEPQDTPAKTNQGIKNHEPHKKKNITHGRKSKAKK